MIPEIMCTLTANQILDEPDLLSRMYARGMRSVRINTAHLSGVDQLGALTAKLKALLPGVRILIDTKGPEMRTTTTAGNGIVTLVEGMHIDIEGTDGDTPTNRSVIYVNYPGIHRDLCAGDRILIDDGTIELEAERVDGTRITAIVRRGGPLGSRKGLAVAGKDINLPAVSDHDRQYISYATEDNDIDLVAHSFVRGADDVLAVRHAMGNYIKPIIAKIENQQGIDNLPGIIAVSSGILIARGDLTASIGDDNITAAQQHIAAVTKAAGKPLYLATNILQSMMHSTEASSEDARGIATAMGQGVDVMLLTNETASGKYPAETVSVLHNIMHNRAGIYQ